MIIMSLITNYDSNLVRNTNTYEIEFFPINYKLISDIVRRNDTNSVWQVN
jgi:hypothetical protein